MNKVNENKGITLLALIITIIVLVILAGVMINTLNGENGIISNAQDVEILSNIKSLEEAIDLYKIDKNVEGKIEEESYPIALNEDGSKITISQMRNASELAKLPDEVKYTLLNLTTEKGTINIPSLDKIDYNKFYKLDYTKLNISQEEAENLVIYIDGDTYKVINLAGVKYKKNDIYVIIPLNNEAEPEYITVANNTYKLYGDGTLKVLGEKTINSGYTSSEVNTINYNLDEFDLKAINEKFDNKMNLPKELTSDWYTSHVYFSTGTAYVIDQNNDLWAWGANDYNKLGLGHSFLVVEPTKILEGRCESTKISKVWAGATNTFIVDLNGKVWGCGTNSFGELGIGKGNTTERYVEISMPNGLNGNEIEYMSLSSLVTYGSTIIKYKNGEVWAMGFNGTGTLGVGYLKSVYNLVELKNFEQCKYISTSGVNTLFIDKNNTAYICGEYLNQSQLAHFASPQKIQENVKQACKNQWFKIRLITLNGETWEYNANLNGVKIDKIPSNENSQLIGVDYIIIDSEIYDINGTKIWENLKNPQVYYENNQIDINNKYMSVLKNENKIYVVHFPDVTKITQKSNYELRKVFENAIFVQGQGSNISIVDKSSNVYESVNGKNGMSNVKKIIASKAQKYIITNDNHLYAKGEATGSIWGDYTNKSDYVEIQKENGEVFDDVKDVWTSSFGNSVIIQTQNNKLYWGGTLERVCLPRNNW